MKIKTKKMEYSKVKELPRAKHKKPCRPWFILSLVVRILAIFDLFPTRFKYTCDKRVKALREPCLILMNHSSFIDLKIASRIFFPKPYAIVSTTDGLVGKAFLMRKLGCIPTQKFVTDLSLIRDMRYALNKLNISVLMYPEAGYSFDGRATPLPERLGALLKNLNVPVVMVKTEGAFSRDPLYNCLQKRKVRVSADVTMLCDKEEIKEKSVEELDEILKNAFTFDSFAWQYENKVKIDEPFRADGLHRILYKCPACMAEGKMAGKGISLTCTACSKKWELSEYGRLAAKDGNTEFEHIPDWYDWQRECVKEEISRGEYSLDVPVDIGMLIDHKALYMVGEGRLQHNAEGFLLEGCGGELKYTQSPLASHELNADYYWYEIGDVIGIGNKDALYYCFPKCDTPVAKARIATEEMFKSAKPKQKRRC